MYVSPDHKGRLFIQDSRALPMIAANSVAVILTSPPYWVRGRGRASAAKYVEQLALQFSREWHRVLAPRGDLWLVIGDRHDGDEWIGVDGLVIERFRDTGWTLHAKGFWAEYPSSSRWDERVNHLLRFKKAGVRALPPAASLCWRLPLPMLPKGSLWNGTPPRIVRELLKLSPRGTVLDPFFGSGTVGLVASRTGRSWIGVERDPTQARVAARRLRLKRHV